MFYDFFGNPRVGLCCFPLEFSLFCLCSTCVNLCSFVFIFVHLCSLVFTCVPFVFTCVPLVFTCALLVFYFCSSVFTCVHLCSLVFHVCSLVLYLCSLVFYLCSFVFICVLLVFICVYLCSFVFLLVWCFRQDLKFEASSFFMIENMFFFCLSLNWIYLSHLTKGPDGERPPNRVMAAVYAVNMRSRARCSKWINMIGLNLRLDFKNTVCAPYALVRI